MANNYYKVTTKDPSPAGDLRMHSSADTNANTVIGTVPKNAVVQWFTLQPDANGMRYVAYNGMQGWVSAEYLTACDADGNSSYDKRTNVVPTTDTTSYDTTTTDGTNGKTWVIVGGCALALGAALNIIL